MDLFKAGIEIDPNGAPSAKDYNDEQVAKYREERGDFKGMYTQGPDDNALRDTNNFRGQSGNNKAMLEEMNAYMRSKGMKAGVDNKYSPHDQAQTWLRFRGMDNDKKGFFEEGKDIDYSDPVAAAAAMGVNVQSADELLGAGEFGLYVIGKSYRKNPSKENLERWIKANEGNMHPGTDDRAASGRFPFDQAMHLGGPTISGPDPDNPASAFPNMKPDPEAPWAERIVRPQQRQYMRQFLEPGKSTWVPDLGDRTPNFDTDDRFYTMDDLRMMKGMSEWEGVDEHDRQFLPNQTERGRQQLSEMQRRIAEDMRNNPLQVNIINDGNWYRKVDEWIKAGEDYVDTQEKSTGIHQGGSRLLMGLVRGFVGEPLRALREIQEADFSRTPSDMPDDGKGVRAVIETATNTGILSTVAPAPAGALRMFGGVGTAERIAKSGADHLAKKPLEAIRKAEAMEKEGKSIAEIRAETNKDLSATPFGGVTKDDSGKWLVEFDDSKMAFTNKAKESFNNIAVGETMSMRLSDLVDMKYMKEMGMNSVWVDFRKNAKHMGVHGNYVGTPNGHITIEAKNLDEAKGLLKHEMQHRLQHVDELESGASPTSKSINPVIAKLVDRRADLREDIQFAQVQIKDLWDKASREAKARGVKPAYPERKDWNEVSADWEVTKPGDYDFSQFSKHWQSKLEEAEIQSKAAWQTYQKEFPGDKSFEYTAYHRMSGEVQARNVDKRGEMTAAQRRATNPETTADVARHLRFRWEDVGPRQRTLAHVSEGGDKHKALREKLFRQGQSIGILEKNINYYKGLDLHNFSPSRQKEIKNAISIYEGRLIKRIRDTGELVKRWKSETGLELPGSMKHLGQFDTKIKGPEQGVPKTLGNHDVWVGNKLHDDIDMD